MNAILLAVFAVTAPWWLRPALAVRPWLPKVSAPRWFWPLVLAAMALTAAMGWQRISYSLWDDEENSLRRRGRSFSAGSPSLAHPHTTELRGYSLTLLLGPLMLYCLLEAISSGRWRWWLGFALSEFALLYAYPGCLYVLIAGNGCGVLALWMRHDTARDRAIYLPRLLVASTLAGIGPDPDTDRLAVKIRLNSPPATGP